jgi:hypothetical protein
LGLLPLVLFGDRAGSNIWDALALVLIGGLLSSTLFVLTITPAAYHVLERFGARRGAGWASYGRDTGVLPSGARPGLSTATGAD